MVSGQWSVVSGQWLVVSEGRFSSERKSIAIFIMHLITKIPRSHNHSFGDDRSILTDRGTTPVVRGRVRYVRGEPLYKILAKTENLLL